MSEYTSQLTILRHFPKIFSMIYTYQARVQRGGPRCPAPPPLEIEKQKKKGHQSKY